MVEAPGEHVGEFGGRAQHADISKSLRHIVLELSYFSFDEPQHNA